MKTVFLNKTCNIKNINEKREACGSQFEENCIEIAKGDIVTIKVKMNAEDLFPLGHHILGGSAPFVLR